MKWIGQHIYDQISRFRNSVYLEDISTGTIASGGNLGLDSNNKIVKATVSSGSGDITSVALGTDGVGLSVTSGDVNWTLAGGNAITTVGSGGDTITINHDDTSSQASVNNSGKAFIQDVTLDTYGHVTGLTSATIGNATDEDLGLASFASADFSVSSGAVSLIDLTVAHFAGAAIQTASESFTDNDTSLMTSAAIDDRINTKYSTSYITFSAKSTSSYGTNYIFTHANGISNVTFSVDSGADSAGDFGGVTTELGGTGTDAVVDIPTASLEQQIPIPETCKLIGFYATTSTTTNTGAGYDTGVAIWHVPEANVNWGGSVAGEATLIHKSDSSRHAENTAHSGSNRKKVQMVKRMDGTAKDLAAGDIIVPSVFGETGNQQIMATITLVIATPIKTI